MNIKKQLKKIAEYVEHLENDNVFLDGKVAEYEQQPPYQSYVDLVAENKRLRERLTEFENMARDFVNFDAPDHICQDAL